MYKDHFGLFTTPFGLNPRLQFLYRSAALDETMAHLVYGLQGGEDIILITGEIGIGKTLALQYLMQNVSASYQVVLINVTQVDFRELLKLLLMEIDVNVQPAADRADLLSALKIRLGSLLQDSKRLLLIVDEAQNLSPETLEGVRLLCNLSGPEHQSLQIILSGQSGLRRLVDLPELAQLRQRIRVHYHLDALTPQEVAGYIKHRLKVAGCDRELFNREAIERIHKLSGGIPRLVNILADRALLNAYVGNRRKVVPGDVEADESLVVSPQQDTIRAAEAAKRSEHVSPDPARSAMPRTTDAVASAAANSEPAARSRRSLLWVIPACVIALAFAWFFLLRDDGVKAGGPAGAETALEAPKVAEAQPGSSSDAAPVPVAGSPAVAGDQVAETAVENSSREAASEPTPETDSGPRAGTVTVVDSTAAHHGIDSLLDPGIYIHIGSFRSLSRAESYIGSVGQHGFSAFLKRVLLSDETWYRVYLGPFTGYENADAVDARLHQENLSAWSMVVRIR